MDDHFSMSPIMVSGWRVFALVTIGVLVNASRIDSTQESMDTNSTNVKSPIQIIPSRLPPPIEKFVERIQNYFSTYNHPDLQNRPYTPQTSVATSTEASTSPEPVSPVEEEEYETELIAEIITTTDEYVAQDV